MDKETPNEANAKNEEYRPLDEKLAEAENLQQNPENENTTEQPVKEYQLKVKIEGQEDKNLVLKFDLPDDPEIREVRVTNLPEDTKIEGAEPKPDGSVYLSIEDITDFTLILPPKVDIDNIIDISIPSTIDRSNNDSEIIIGSESIHSKVFQILPPLNGSGTPVFHPYNPYGHNTNLNNYANLSSSQNLGPTVSTLSGTTQGQTEEDNTQTVHGSLHIHTSNLPSGSRAPIFNTNTFQGTYGKLSVNSHGQWTYVLDNTAQNVQALSEGQVVHEHFTVSSSDGKSLPVIINITGKNDVAVISGVDTGVVTEDTSLHTGGTLTISDVDTGENHFTTTDLSGQYGTLHLNANGSWTYDLDTKAAQVQSLGLQQTSQETFTIKSIDGTTHQITITVTGTNDQPQLTPAKSVQIAEGSALIDGQLHASDIDHGAQLFFSALAPTPGFSIDSDGQWHFDPQHSAFEHLAPGQQSVLQIPVQVTDEHGATATQVLEITVTGTNDSPIMSLIPPQKITEDHSPLTGHIQVHDLDDGDSFTCSTQNPIPGFTLNTDGSYSFDPSHADYQSMASGEKSVLQIPISVTDSHGASNTQVLQITIVGTDDAPVLHAVPPLTLAEDALVHHGQMQATDIDHGAQLTFDTPMPIAGFMINPDGSYSFDPSHSSYQHLAPGDRQIVTVPITVHDEHGQTGTQTLQFTVTGTNDAPVIQTTPPRSVNEDGHTINGQIISRDVDTGDQAHFHVPGNVPGFTLSPDGHYQFDPSDSAYQHLAAGVSQQVTVPVFVTDGHGASVNTQLTFTVIGTNDAPVIGGIDQALAAVASAKSGLVKSEGQLTIVDLDSGESHFHTQLIQGSYGVLAIDPIGHWTYTADANQQALVNLQGNTKLPEHFTITSADGSQHNINLDIVGNNNPAIIGGTTATMVKEDVQVERRGQMVVSDPDAGESSFVATDRDTQYGHITLSSDGQWHYQLNTGNQAVQSLPENSMISEHIIIGTADGTPQVFTVNIIGTNDAAVITGSSTGAVTEDTQVQTIGKLSITDVDTGEDHFQDGDLTGSYGTLHIATDGGWTYDLDNNNPAVQALGDGDQLTETISVKAADGTTQTVTLTVNGTNDVAQIGGTATGSVTEESTLQASGQLTITDVDTGEDHFQDGDLTGSYGTLHIATDGSWTYDLDNTNNNVQTLGNGETLTDQVTIRSIDGTTHTISIDINGTNDTPNVASAVILPAGTEDVTETITTAQLLANATDIDSTDTLSVANLAVDHGTISGPDSLGNIHFTPEANYNGKVSFSYDVTDSHGGTVHTSASTDLAAVQDAAVFGGQDTGVVTEDKIYGMQWLMTHGTMNITDPDSGEAQFVPRATGQKSGYPTHMGGLLTLTPKGDWAYILNNDQSSVQSLGTGETAIDRVTVHSVDGTSHVIQITIHGTNDAPKISSVVSLPAGTEDTDMTIKGSDLLAHASDIDYNDAGQLTVANLVADHGTITDNHDGTFNFQPDPDFNGKVTFTYDVHDAHGGTVHTSAITDLAAVGDPAVITGTDTGSITEDHHFTHDSAHEIEVDGRLTISDPDSGQDHFQATNPFVGHEKVISDPFQGELRIDRFGNWNYRLANGNPAVQSLADGETKNVIYEVKSADGTTHRITIAVHGTNDAPVLQTQTQSVTEDGSQLTGQMHATDVDHGDNAKFTTSANIAGFHLNDDGSYTFDPSDAAYNHLGAGDHQTLTIPVTVTDANGAKDAQNLVIMVNGTNDTPVVSAPVTLPSGTEDVTETITTAQLLANATDVDSTDTLSVANIAVDHGTITGPDSAGKIQFTPEPDYNGKVTFTYDVTDSHGGTVHTSASTDLATVQDAAVISGQDHGAITEDNSVNAQGMIETSGKLDVVDPDAGEAVFNAQTHLGVYGEFKIDSDGNWTYKADNSQTDIQKLGANEHLSDSMWVTTADGSHVRITVDIQGSNDFPTVTVAALSGSEDQDYQFTAANFGFTDVDTSDTMDHVTITGLPDATEGQLLLNGVAVTANQDIDTTDIPNLKFSPATDFNGDVHFKYTVNDGSTNSAEATGTIGISAVNDDATINAQTHSSSNDDLTEGATQNTVSGQLNLQDVDAGENEFVANSHIQGIYGYAKIAKDGSWTYHLDNSLPTTNQLLDGQQVREQIVIHSPDGTADHTINVTVHGHSDVLQSSVTEGDPSTSIDLFNGVSAATGITGMAFSMDGGKTFTHTTPKGISIDADGHTLHIDPSSTDFDHLGAGHSDHIQMLYQIQEGGNAYIQTANIEVKGTADAPVVHSVQVSGKDSAPITGDLMSEGHISDVDDNAVLHVDRFYFHDGSGYHYIDPNQNHDLVHDFAGKGTLTIHQDGTYNFNPVNGYSGSLPSVYFSVTDTANSVNHFDVTVRPLNISVQHDTSVLGQPVAPGLAGSTSGPQGQAGLTGATGTSAPQAPVISAQHTHGQDSITLQSTDHSGNFALDHRGDTSLHNSFGTVHIDPNTGHITFQTSNHGNPHTAHHGTFEIYQHGQHVADISVTGYNHHHYPTSIEVHPIVQQHDAPDPDQDQIDNSYLASQHSDQTIEDPLVSFMSVVSEPSHEHSVNHDVDSFMTHVDTSHEPVGQDLHSDVDSFTHDIDLHTVDHPDHDEVTKQALENLDHDQIADPMAPTHNIDPADDIHEGNVEDHHDPEKHEDNQHDDDHHILDHDDHLVDDLPPDDI